jgi:hypothetical protein
MEAGLAAAVSAVAMAAEAHGVAAVAADSAEEGHPDHGKHKTLVYSCLYAAVAMAHGVFCGSAQGY